LSENAVIFTFKSVRIMISNQAILRLVCAVLTWIYTCPSNLAGAIDAGLSHTAGSAPRFKFTVARILWE